MCRLHTFSAHFVGDMCSLVLLDMQSNINKETRNSQVKCRNAHNVNGTRSTYAAASELV